VEVPLTEVAIKGFREQTRIAGRLFPGDENPTAIRKTLKTTWWVTLGPNGAVFSWPADLRSTQLGSVPARCRSLGHATIAAWRCQGVGFCHGFATVGSILTRFGHSAVSQILEVV
jgi:hypothetical protein